MRSILSHDGSYSSAEVYEDQGYCGYPSSESRSGGLFECFRAPMEQHQYERAGNDAVTLEKDSENNVVTKASFVYGGPTGFSGRRKY